MRITQNVLVSVALLLLSVPMLSAQSFSKYRNFSLGSSLAVVSKQADVTQSQINVIHQAPVLMQDVTYWPGESGTTPMEADAVQQMQLSFCNGGLYSINVLYKSSATQGLSDEDMIQAVSITYGVATRSAPDKNLPETLKFGSPDVQLATWQDSQDSVTLSRSPLSKSFHLIVLSKQLQAQADAATAQDIAQELQDAPKRAADRAKQEVQDQQDVRDANLKAFRP
jgi:hypothetical protein